MSAHARDPSAAFGLESGLRAPWFRVALDVLPGLLDPVSSDGVAVAITRGVVRHFAFASAIDCVDPVLGLRRVAFAWQPSVSPPAACRWAPAALPRGWCGDRALLLPDEAPAVLFTSLPPARVVSVPLFVDGAREGHLWLLAHAERPFDETDLGIASELARWASSALARARMVDAMARRAERDAELTAVVEHELRAPLGTLVGWGRLLASEPERETDRMRRGLAAIERGGRDMTRVIEDWHEASRMLLGGIALDRRPASVGALVRSVVAARRATLEASGAKISVETTDDVPASIDEARVRQMLERMLDRIERGTPTGAEIVVRTATHGHAIVIAIEGRAPGPRARPVSSAPERGGRALSDRTLTFAIVRGIAELHGGSAGAERGGSGFASRIWALLPVHTPPVASRELEEPADLRGVHVLLVDDARDSLELAATIVRLRGGQAALAGSSSEAIELLRTLPIDVLVSDIAMPVEDGCSLIRRAHELRPGLRAAALSAHAHVEDRERALAAGFETYLVKPVDPEALALVVRSLAHDIPAARP